MLFDDTPFHVSTYRDKHSRACVKYTSPWLDTRHMASLLQYRLQHLYLFTDDPGMFTLFQMSLEQRRITFRHAMIFSCQGNWQDGCHSQASSLLRCLDRCSLRPPYATPAASSSERPPSTGTSLGCGGASPLRSSVASGLSCACAGRHIVKFKVRTAAIVNMWIRFMVFSV